MPRLAPAAMPAKATLKRIISASRRTDLVAHYPDQLAGHLLRLGPDTIHSVVVWTKDVTNLLQYGPLRDALNRVGQVFVHWTITGLGGSLLEPNVPPSREQVRLASELASYLGDPRRLHWRYDPLVCVRCGPEVVGNVSIPLFRSLAEPLARAGVTVVHTSFATLYPKVSRRFAAAGVEAVSLEPEARRDFLVHLSATAADTGIRLVTCCEPGFDRQRCIDGDLLTELHPQHEPCRTDRARGQRELCGCTVSLDVGRYLPCPNRCLYCYAHPAA